MRRKMKKEKLYFLKQKLWGIVITGIGMLIPFVDDGNATASVLIIPFGLYLIFTKEKVMMFD